MGGFSGITVTSTGYYVSDFTLQECTQSGEPFLVSWEQTNSVENSVSTCNGSITNLSVSGGTPPYVVSLTYPIGTVLSGNNFTNLCPGLYTATTIDSIGTTENAYITITDLNSGALTAGTIDNSCVYNINEFCSIEVSGFTHSSDNFMYLLYKDNNLYQTYEGGVGDENYIFTNLTTGNYTLTAYDGYSATLQSETPQLCDCIHGYTLDSSTVFGQSINTYSGLSTNQMVSDFRRFNLYNLSYFAFGTLQGPHTLPPFNTNPNGIVFESGIEPDGTIRVDDPYVWLYTGETSTRKTENTVDWYLGEFNLPMEDGDNVGPAGYTLLTDIGKFYYNTYIKKFVFLANSDVFSGTFPPDAWVTINATANRGQNLLPIAINNNNAGLSITGSAAYNSIIVTPTAQVGYTPTGTTMDVISWNDLGSGAYGLRLSLNSQPTFLVSKCKYLNYVHKLSLGSSDTDNDTIGVILATFIDDNGLYSPKGTPHYLTLQFSNSSSIYNYAVSVQYNGFSNAAYSFRLSGRTTVDCGYETTNGCSSSVNNPTPITGISSTILINDYSKSPFSLGSYAGQGTTYLRIERSGMLGEKFNIKMTDLITSADVGTSVSYNPDYEISFNLLDKKTWVGNNGSAEYYATEQDLYKFLGSQSFGYFRSSQPNSYFYNISFTGVQSNYLFESLEFGGSDTQQFQLGTPELQGVITSTGKEINYYNSLGSGGEVGNPTIPTVRPTPTVTMQTTQIPIMETTGATKINKPTNEYIIYEETLVETGKEEPCVEFNFTWTKNTTDLLNGNMVPYYSIHSYIPEERTFSEAPLLTRIFDNPQGKKLIQTSNRQVIGEGLEASDCIKLSQLAGSSEFIIKPNYIFKDKLKNLEHTPCNVVIDSLTGVTTGITKTEKWYDTFDPNPDFKVVGNEDSTGIFSWESDGKINTREYGFYDSTTDFYFLIKPEIPELNLETNDILYGINNSCGKLATQQITVYPNVTDTTGTTTTPFVTSGTPFTVTLDFPAAGPLQVTLNGLTLFPSQFSDLSDDGDYYFDGNSQVKFRADTVEGYDVINLIYVPGTFERSYYYDNYVVPATIPNVSGGTSVTGNTLYTNGYYYYFRTTYTPIGDIGITLNGSVLFPDSDYKLIKNNTIQFTGIQYPDGLTENDVIGQFYFTKFNLLGAAGIKNPKVNVNIRTLPLYTYELLLIVRDTNGTIVYTEKQLCEPYDEYNASEFVDGENYEVIQKTFTIDVPSPGKYSYNIITTTLYTLINGDKISDTITSESYSFSISAAVFYDESGDFTINTPTIDG